MSGRGAAAAMALVLAVPLAGQAVGQDLLAAHTLRIGSIVGPGDLRLVDDAAADPKITEAAIEPYVGLEVRRAIYAGRPVTPSDLGPPTLVTRNAVVTMVFDTGSLAIRTEGRALDAGGEGERVRVMNLDSRLSVRATVVGPNLVAVLP